jgi:hypothetical protein
LLTHLSTEKDKSSRERDASNAKRAIRRKTSFSDGEKKGVCVWMFVRRGGKENGRRCAEHRADRELATTWCITCLLVELLADLVQQVVHELVRILVLKASKRLVVVF